MLIFTEGFEHLSEEEIDEWWDKPSRFLPTEMSRLVLCKPEDQQCFSLIGCEFVDDLADTEN